MIITVSPTENVLLSINLFTFRLYFFFLVVLVNLSKWVRFEHDAKDCRDLSNDRDALRDFWFEEVRPQDVFQLRVGNAEYAGWLLKSQPLLVRTRLSFFPARWAKKLRAISS